MYPDGMYSCVYSIFILTCKIKLISGARVCEDPLHVAVVPLILKLRSNPGLELTQGAHLVIIGYPGQGLN